MNIETKRKIAFALMMGIATTGIISLAIIALNIGFTERFFLTWIRSWVIAYVIVIPAILVIGPPLQAQIDRVIK